jgi:hypothetical protein
VWRPGLSFGVNQWNRISCSEATARAPSNQPKTALEIHEFLRSIAGKERIALGEEAAHGRHPESDVRPRCHSVASPASAGRPPLPDRGGSPPAHRLRGLFLLARSSCTGARPAPTTRLPPRVRQRRLWCSRHCLQPSVSSGALLEARQGQRSLARFSRWGLAARWRCVTLGGDDAPRWRPRHSGEALPPARTGMVMDGQGLGGCPTRDSSWQVASPGILCGT